ELPSVSSTPIGTIESRLKGETQMSPNRLLLCVFFCALVVAGAGSFTAQSGDARAQADQEVLKINAECNAAELRGDVKAMDACETEDFTHTHASGQVEHKAEYLKG